MTGIQELMEQLDKRKFLNNFYNLKYYYDDFLQVTNEIKLKK